MLHHTKYHAFIKLLSPPTGHLETQVITYILDENSAPSKHEGNDKGILYYGDGTSSYIETYIRCSNIECIENDLSSGNEKKHRRLYTAARQMEEDVNRHVLADNPQGEQVFSKFQLLL